MKPHEMMHSVHVDFKFGNLGKLRSVIWNSKSCFSSRVKTPFARLKVAPCPKNLSNVFSWGSWQMLTGITSLLKTRADSR